VLLRDLKSRNKHFLRSNDNDPNSFSMIICHKKDGFVFDMEIVYPYNDIHVHADYISQDDFANKYDQDFTTQSLDDFIESLYVRMRRAGSHSRRTLIQRAIDMAMCLV
jgi:hypothetical protein